MNDRLIMVDGRLHPADAPVLRADDRGFLYGDGAFETIRVVDGHPQWLDRHLARLTSTLETLGIEPPAAATLITGVTALIHANGLSVGEAAIRISISRGAGGGLRGTPAWPTVVIAARSLGETMDRRRRATRLRTVGGLQRMLPHLKTLCYLPGLLACAGVEPDEEPLLVSADGHALEGVTTNIFALSGDALITPPADNVLPGIARGLIIELAPRCDLSVRCAPLPAQALARADAVLVSNALLPIAPVERLDGEAMPTDAGRRLAARLGALMIDTRRAGAS